MLSPHTGHDPGADWRSRANCRDADAEIFFPTAESGHLVEAEVAAARAVCAACPVVEPCLEFAREWLPYGVAGGLTPAERRRQTGGVRSRRRAPSPPVDGRRSRVAEAGRAALLAGRSRADVAHEFGVSDRTVCRWAAANRTGSLSPATAGRGVA